MSMLTVNEVASLLKVRPKRVRELIRSERIVAMDLTKGGGRPTYRIDAEDLQHFQDSAKLVKPAESHRRRRLADTADVIEFIK